MPKIQSLGPEQEWKFITMNLNNQMEEEIQVLARIGVTLKKEEQSFVKAMLRLGYSAGFQAGVKVGEQRAKK